MMRVLFFMMVLVLPMTAMAEGGFVQAIEPLGRTPSDLAVERVTLTPQPVAVTRVMGKPAEAPALIPKAIAELQEKIRASGVDNLLKADPPLAMFVQADESSFSADVMMPVTGIDQAKAAGFTFTQSPAGKALRIVHVGPLDSIEDTYFELQTFVEDQGFDVGDYTLERYMADPAKTAPKDMRTEVYVPLK